MEKIRNRRHFLPKYSEYYFKRKEKVKNDLIAVFIYVYLFAFMICITIECNLKTLIVIALCHVMYLFFLRKLILSKKKNIGYLLTKTDIVRYGWFMERRISYETIANDVKAGYMHYDKYALVVGRNSRRLEFHYEIGASAAQEHIKECYEELKKILQIELLPYHAGTFRTMDALYYYGTSRRNQIISLILSVLTFAVAMYANYDATALVRVVWALIVALWQCVTLYLLIKNVALTTKYIQNYDAKLEDEKMDFVYKAKNKHYVQAIISILFMFICNLLIIMNLYAC
ncbi:MAG: hypothetical protein IJY81_01255 [Lachnospiraceae bacterium]|nr:hypothetical protein [Lachnospiraceae bacterium]